MPHKKFTIPYIRPPSSALNGFAVWIYSRCVPCLVVGVKELRYCVYVTSSVYLFFGWGKRQKRLSCITIHFEDTKVV